MGLRTLSMDPSHLLYLAPCFLETTLPSHFECLVIVEVAAGVWDKYTPGHCWLAQWQSASLAGVKELKLNKRRLKLRAGKPKGLTESCFPLHRTEKKGSEWKQTTRDSCPYFHEEYNTLSFFSKLVQAELLILSTKRIPNVFTKQNKNVPSVDSPGWVLSCSWCIWDSCLALLERAFEVPPPLACWTLAPFLSPLVLNSALYVQREE
jgi:hypothetical protein